jgi:hypothetical protein
LKLNLFLKANVGVALARILMRDYEAPPVEGAELFPAYCTAAVQAHELLTGAVLTLEVFLKTHSVDLATSRKFVEAKLLLAR